MGWADWLRTRQKLEGQLVGDRRQRLRAFTALGLLQARSAAVGTAVLPH